eukprot:3818013-Pleurochrysis_carterae.AAC.1
MPITRLKGEAGAEEEALKLGAATATVVVTATVAAAAATAAATVAAAAATTAAAEHREGMIALAQPFVETGSARRGRCPSALPFARRGVCHTRPRPVQAAH